MQRGGSDEQKREGCVLGLVLLLPAVVLVSSGLLGLEPPAAFVHPLLVMGGLLVALVANGARLLRIRLGQEEGAVFGTLFSRLRGTALNFAVLAFGSLLLAAIMAYAFVENFQLR